MPLSPSQIMHPHRPMRTIVLCAAVGAFAGLAATLLLYGLQELSAIRERFPALIYLLPLAGGLVGFLLHRYGNGAERGTSLILDEIHDPKRTVPLRMTPFMLISTGVTHLFGGSAGREGTAVQMGASLADGIAKRFMVDARTRRHLLMAGVGAGFSAGIGAPWAGLMFGLEVIQVGKLSFAAAVECAIASFIAYGISHLLRAPHAEFAPFIPPKGSVALFSATLIASAVFGGVAWVFIRTTHSFEASLKRWIHYPPLRPVIGGTFTVLLFVFLGSRRYEGLGMPVIQEALRQPVSFFDPLWKAIATVFTVGSGFKGGEFVPLVFIGTTLGSALAGIFSVPASYLAALGFSATFAAAANTPLACTFMAMELFGLSIGPYAAVACFTAYFVTGGNTTLYPGQKFVAPKTEPLITAVRSIRRR